MTLWKHMILVNNVAKKNDKQIEVKSKIKTKRVEDLNESKYPKQLLKITQKQLKEDKKRILEEYHEIMGLKKGSLNGR